MNEELELTCRVLKWVVARELMYPLHSPESSRERIRFKNTSATQIASVCRNVNILLASIGKTMVIEWKDIIGPEWSAGFDYEIFVRIDGDKTKA
jgi:hypothetical protein